MDPDPRIKEAFSKVKEDMLSIKLSLEELKKEILSSNNKNNALKNELYELKSILEEKKTNNNPFFLDSTGNKGVFRQTDNRQTTEVRQIFDTQPHLESIFISLTEKEFLLFLTLYQLEEEIRIISARKATKKEAKLYEERIWLFKRQGSQGSHCRPQKC